MKESKSTVSVGVASVSRAYHLMSLVHVVSLRSPILTITTHRMLQILNLCQRRILSTSAQQIAERVDLHTAGAALVE